MVNIIQRKITMLKLEINNYGHRFWYNKNGKLHRIDGPAIEFNDGDKYWYKNGLKHRLNGPAMEWNNGYKEWYINGIEYSEEAYNEKIRNK